MKLVILESPFRGNITQNTTYARRAVRDSVLRGESPLASHLLFTQPGILNDDIPEERQLGIEAGLAWKKHADKTVVYQDYGITGGMDYGIEEAEDAGIEVEYRSIGKNGN